MTSARWGALAVLLLTATVASARLSSQNGAELADAHGVAHDRRAEAALSRWVARGRPAGTASVLPAQAGDADRTITLRSQGSNLDFEPNRISAKAGTRLRVEYVNDGVLPHNFVLLYDEDDLDMLGMASYEAETTGFVPVELHADKMIAYTKLANPGETVEVTFEVPPPGEYLFACIFPGHYNVMIGTLRSVG